MEISEIIKSARIKKGMTQQQLADSVYVTRQTISKWELGKSIPDEASLHLLYQCLPIENEEKAVMRKLTGHKQTVFLIIIALAFSPLIIGIRFCLFKIGKLEDKRFKIILQSFGLIIFAYYLRSLKDHVADLLIFITSFGYFTYQYYMLSLERKNN